MTKKLELASELRKLREMRGWSREEVAHRANLSLSTMYLVERGAASDASMELVAKTLAAPATEERSFFGVAMRRGDAHLDAISKTLSLPPPSADEEARIRRSLDDMRMEGVALKVAGARDGVSRVVKAGTAGAARTELDELERVAATAVATAKDVGRGLARALAVNPSIFEPSRAALAQTFEELCAEARAACVRCVKACHAVLATTEEASELEAIGARAATYIDTVANLRDLD